jgi:hypothetical protein
LDADGNIDELTLYKLQPDYYEFLIEGAFGGIHLIFHPALWPLILASLTVLEIYNIFKHSKKLTKEPEISIVLAIQHLISERRIKKKIGKLNEPVEPTVKQLLPVVNKFLKRNHQTFYLKQKSLNERLHELHREKILKKKEELNEIRWKILQ